MIETYEQVKKRAEANAALNGEVWVVFSASDGWRCERYRAQKKPLPCMEIVRPSKLTARFISRINSELEGWDVIDLLPQPNACKEGVWLMTIYDEDFVQATVDWLNKCYRTFLLGESYGIIDPSEGISNG